ncbi:MAG: quinol monooxygenase YgiN [Candidatus Poriferisodalaceae bacterium]|jgi:quinol monooxygenase YgiN
MTDSANQGPPRVPVPDDDLEIAILSITFQASDPDALLSVLSKYVVLSRNTDGCRNIDLCASYADPTRFLLIEKWNSETHARAHLNSSLMVEMAEGCNGILSAAPDIDLLEGVSAHDLA